MCGDLLELLKIHMAFLLLPLQKENTKNQNEQMIGSIFLENAPKLEEIHKAYCSNHPKAVQIVERHKEVLSSYFESKGCPKKPGILFLITSLSQPFRRLEKYPLLLQEVERHVEEFHKDRGDLQRSIEYYKEIQVCVSRDFHI
jgi:Rho guanine nucleotide exchange factor 7